MIRKKKHTDSMIVDLTGPQGNAWYLLGLAKTLSRQLGLDYKPITDEMMSGDYENLITVFDTHFGEYVILER